MEQNNTRIFLIIALVLVGLLLFGTWQKEEALNNASSSTTITQPNTQPTAQTQDLPLAHLKQSAPAVSTAITSQVNQIDLQRLITVENDVLRITVDKLGGDIISAELKQYPEEHKHNINGMLLLDNSANRNYIAQSGLIHEKGPDSPQHRALYQHIPTENPLEIALHWKNPEGVDFTKKITLHSHQYLIDVNYMIDNHSAAVFHAKIYGQLRQVPPASSSGFLMGMQMYRGSAVYTPDKPYKKLPFDKMAKTPFNQTIQGGWAAMVEHYFVAAWIPNKDAQNTYYAYEKEGFYYTGSISDYSVQPQSQKTINNQFYVGPELADVLKTISPGLDLTVDYGILWPISLLLFWLLKQLYQFVGNWGWSIILVTLIIKLAFYKLSAASYRSMGNMRRIQPKMQALKERLGDDKQAFGQAMMELYRKEKINPLGGCLPILVQIPVFIALYYVLLESVELRQAPFIFWLQDLSTKDPYYILPLLMGVTMFVQQKMSPAPPDPMQAKVMMAMPVIFTVLFLQFPSGLVLYWVVNNILSMLQQFYITQQLNNIK